MVNHRVWRALSFTCLAILLAGCGSAGLTSIQVTPTSQSLSTAGANAQFTAIGIYRQGNHPPTTRNITNLVTWQSSDGAVATINSAGLATAVASGSTTISASMNGFTGLESATATLTVTGSGTVAGPAGANTLTSLTIIPGSQAVVSVNETGQFLAIGSFVGSGGAAITEDLTDQVAWSSSDVKVATINTSGLATGINKGSTTILAIAKAPSGTLTTATATFTENSTGNGTQLATLTVYKVGNNASVGTVTGPTINCGSGSGCIGNFPLGPTVTLTAIPGTNSTFGGWSANCSVPNPGYPPKPPYQCTVVMVDNTTVGAIFN